VARKKQAVKQEPPSYALELLLDGETVSFGSIHLPHTLQRLEGGFEARIEYLGREGRETISTMFIPDEVVRVMADYVLFERGSK